MYLEVLEYPESQEVMKDPEWFFIMANDIGNEIIGSSAYARVIDLDEELNKYSLEKYKDELNEYHEK